MTVSMQSCADTCLFAVQGEMDELEREEFFRLKKVQAKKKVQQALRDKATLEVRGWLDVIHPTAAGMLCTPAVVSNCPLGGCGLQPTTCASPVQAVHLSKTPSASFLHHLDAVH